MQIGCLADEENIFCHFNFILWSSSQHQKLIEFFSLSLHSCPMKQISPNTVPPVPLLTITKPQTKKAAMSTQMNMMVQEEKKSTSKKVQPQSVTRMVTLFAIVVVIIAQSVIVPTAEARYLPTRSNVDQLKRQEIKEILRLVSKRGWPSLSVFLDLLWLTPTLHTSQFSLINFLICHSNIAVGPSWIWTTWISAFNVE